MKHSDDSWSTSEIRSIVHKHMWTIHGFSQLECRFLETNAKIKDLSAAPSNELSSSGELPDLSDITFRIRLYPQGNKKSNKDFTFFQCFTNQSTLTPPPKTNYKAELKFSVLNSLGDESRTTVHSGTEENLHGYFEYIHRGALISHVQPSDDLHLSLNITVTFDTVTKGSENICSISPELPQPIEVTKDLENMFRSGKYADFTLIVEGRKIKAHRAILAARSPVFAAMLEPHTTEAQKNCVLIEDMEYDAVQHLLHYIYTGTCSEMGTHALEILAAAKKYQLLGLKNLAEHAMRNNLATDTVCEHLHHADVYNLHEFKKEALKFICLNANAVINSKGFLELSRSTPHLIAEIMSTLVNDRYSGPSMFKRDDHCESLSKRARM